jgi:hypothetical protein
LAVEGAAAAFVDFLPLLLWLLLLWLLLCFLLDFAGAAAAGAEAPAAGAEAASAAIALAAIPNDNRAAVIKVPDFFMGSPAGGINERFEEYAGSAKFIRDEDHFTKLRGAAPIPQRRG